MKTGSKSNPGEGEWKILFTSHCIFLLLTFSFFHNDNRPDESVPQDEKAPSMGAKSLCKPFQKDRLPIAFHNLDMLEQLGARPLTPDSCCVACSKTAKTWCLFGRSY